MKLAEVIRLMALFGYREVEVRTRLAEGDSVHNAWEGLKLELALRFKEAEEQLGPERLEGLREAYEKLTSLQLKDALKQSEVDREERARFKKIASEMEYQARKARRRNLVGFARALERELERGLEENPGCERMREALEGLRRGETPW